ncbi:hypothetical protein ACFE04_025380 [Oxalis oulophora]
MEVMSFQQADFNFNSRFSTGDSFCEDFENKLKMRDDDVEELMVDDIDNDYEEEEEFSFASVNSDVSSTDDVIKNGEVRLIFPVFGKDISGLIGDDDSIDYKSFVSPLKKVFVEEQSSSSSSSSEPAGPFCEWRGKTVREVSHDSCRKSNSTGFSKLLRIRKCGLKCNSDGKDAFVFLNDATDNDMITTGNNESEIKKEKVKKSKKNEETTSLTAYMKSKAKENDKRKVYLPYKQVGFFTNVNGLTRNIHPY